MLTDRLEAELLAERGLPLAWYDVLFQLSLAPGGERRMQELAGAVLLSKSGLTRLVSRMEQAGLVERRPCPTDLRGTIAALTPAGAATLRRARPVHLRGIREHFARHLSDEEARTLRAAFGKLLAEAGREDRSDAVNPRSGDE
ncbi:MAG TPA: MarR family transcriptional regulator [Dehalococcoidia bacterium]|nr:MarR family transcriptional regulator [Dehalococcoidia bacterium]